MNLLAISSIFPIPGIKEENDIVSAIYRNLELFYPEIRIFRYMPIPYVPSFVAKIPGPNIIKQYAKLNRQGMFDLDGNTIRVLGGLMLRSPLFFRYHTLKLFYVMIRSQLLNAIEIHKTDVIHANYVNLDGYFAWKLHKEVGIPYVVTGRSVELKFMQLPAYAQLFQQITSDASGFTALNSTSADIFQSFTDKPVNLIPHGLDDHLFDDSYNYRRSGKKLRLLSIGKLLKRKNIDKVLEALSYLKTEGLDFEYTIIGRGPERSRLEQLTRIYGIAEDTTFLNAVPYQDIPDVYRTHDIFVLPSKPEAFGRVFFEAMAAGIPVICADEWGINGFYEQEVSAIGVNPENTNAIAAAVRKLNDQPRLAESIARNGNMVAKLYRWPEVSRMYYQALNI